MQTFIKLPGHATVNARGAKRRTSVSPSCPPRPLHVDESCRHLEADDHRSLGFAAHELRSPLFAICGLAEFLREGAVGELTPLQRNLVVNIHRASQAALELVSQLLDFQAEAMHLVYAPRDLNELVKESIALSTLEAVRKDMQIMFTPHEPVVLKVDGAKVTQVITNLLSNALKYSPCGSTIRIRIEFDATAHTCMIGVQDQGPGIPDAERHKLFSVFGRLTTEPTGGEKSIGLGLALCRRIMEAHQGKIDHHNLPKGGCEFRIVLPVQPHGVAAEQSPVAPAGRVLTVNLTS